MNTIFIHIPKTGGTTLNCAIQGSEWQSTPDFNSMHIIYKTKKSISGDIFKKRNWKRLKEFDLLRFYVIQLIVWFLNIIS